MASMHCDSASESDASSIDGSSSASAGLSFESLKCRMDSLLQEKRVLRMEAETLKLSIKSLQQENQSLRRTSVNIQAQAEQEEEYITNTMLKKIQSLQQEKERLAQSYEQEEEHLTNDLTKRLRTLQQEKVDLEAQLEREQEAQVNKLLKRIDRLENEVTAKQSALDQLRQEKVALENSLEQEQESLVNRLWKQMEKLEAEKKNLQKRLEGDQQPQRRLSSTSDMQVECSLDDPEAMLSNISQLKADLGNLRKQLDSAEAGHRASMSRLVHEERSLQAENVCLRKRLDDEELKRDRLTRNLSESDAGSDAGVAMETEPKRQQLEPLCLHCQKRRQNLIPSPSCSGGSS
ncbi:hypothetical protein BOX15_Mlig023712g3 [Macrostomum lignano]|uniref:Coiled-coil domain-containing protein 6 n=2 Tax=Macrostomum lignano TaxID=282301 RepID=A0A1I8H022_9PLAT|nr:hypothetical protein BOX15_Mlig023712g3 [Macrostomum lignano]